MIDAPTLEGLTIEESAELEQLEAVIDQNFIQMGNTLLEIKNKRLWREYGTWEHYCRERWLKSARRIDQLIQGSLLAAQIENIRSELPPVTSEFQARSLAGLSIEEAAEVWETTVEAYETTTPTAAQVANTRDRIETDSDNPSPTEGDKTKRMVYAAGFALVTQRMNEGDLTPKKALAVCDALQSAMPRVRGDLLTLELYDDVMIRELNRLFKKQSESYDEIVRSKHLQFDGKSIPVQKAKAQDLRNWLDWKSAEHRSAAYASKLVRDRWETQVISVGENSIEFNVPAIEDQLKPGDKVFLTIVRM